MAVATLIAQGVSAVLSFFLLMRKLKGYEEEEKYGCYDFGMMRSMVKIAVPSTLQQSIVHMGILLVQSVVNSFGSAALAGYSAGSRIESLSIVPMLAMGNAMSTFTAQNIGAGKLDRVKAVSYTHLDVYKRQTLILSSFPAVCARGSSSPSLWPATRRS